MINLIRMNLIRMFRMKSIYVMLVACLLFATIFVTEAQDTSTDDLEQQMIAEQTEQGNAADVGITIDTTADNSTLAWFLAEFDSSGLLLILVGIFMSLLACSERDSGFLKNLSSCNQHKWQIVVARLVPGFLCTIILQAGMFIFLFLLNVIYGGHLAVGNFTSLLVVVALQTLLHTAFAAFVLVIAEISHSLLVCNLVSIFTGFGFAGLLVSFVSPALLNYMILGRVKSILLPLDAGIIPVTLVVGVITLIAYTVLSSFIFQKRDTY